MTRRSPTDPAPTDLAPTDLAPTDLAPTDPAPTAAQPTSGRAVDTLLRRVRARLAFVGALENAQRGLVAACAFVLVAFVVRRVFPSTADTLDGTLIGAVALAVLLAFPLVGLVVRRNDRRRVAAVADERFGLAERVSTALYLDRREEGDRTGAAAPAMGRLVRDDAAARAGAVRAATVRTRIRPVFDRRATWASAALCACCVAVVLAGPGTASVLETDEQRTARLADENRIADVARRMAEAAERVQRAAEERKESELAQAARRIAQETRKMSVSPPRREQALENLNKLSDEARRIARKRAGMAKAPDAREAREGSKALAELLRKMADAGLESLQKDMEELRKRLESGEQGEPSSPDDLRALANRLDALRRAMESAEANGMSDLREQMRSFGNEDLLEKIAQRMRELASRMEQGEEYEDLQQDASDAMDSLDLSQMSREELEELLKQLDEMGRARGPLRDDAPRRRRDGRRPAPAARRLRGHLKLRRVVRSARQRRSGRGQRRTGQERWSGRFQAGRGQRRRYRWFGSRRGRTASRERHVRRRHDPGHRPQPARSQGPYLGDDVPRPAPSRRGHPGVPPRGRARPRRRRGAPRRRVDPPSLPRRHPALFRRPGEREVGLRPAFTDDRGELTSGRSLT